MVGHDSWRQITHRVDFNHILIGLRQAGPALLKFLVRSLALWGRIPVPNHKEEQHPAESSEGDLKTSSWQTAVGCVVGTARGGGRRGGCLCVVQVFFWWPPTIAQKMGETRLDFFPKNPRRPDG